MNISIVMAYYNRLPLLEYTLKTINMTKYDKKKIEVIIVDDGSDESHIIPEYNYEYHIKVIRIDPKDKQHINSCVPYNIGFKNATGDIIIIQNPEVCHIGDIISNVVDSVQNGLYLTYTCVNFPVENYNEWLHERYNALSDINHVKTFVKTLQNIHGNNTQVWYNHPIYRAANYHFLSAIMKSDLDKLGGFDERYAYGSGYDDDEFLFRIKQILKVKTIYPDNAFSIHQWHPKLNQFTDMSLVERNKVLFLKLAS